ncbi:hypothetical protein QYF36_026472 [Acer negundo]|nr:hypothetical protein QYF36_026472 [Acer negundo]
MKCRQIDEAYKMFDRMLKRDLVSWNTIISVYAQNGLARMALEFVVQMHEEGAWRPYSITIVSIFPAVVNIAVVNIWYLRTGKAVHGSETDQRMPIEPGITVLGANLGSCKIHKNVESGEKAANRMFELNAG